MPQDWSDVRDLLQEVIGAENTDTWFGPARFLGVRGSDAVLSLPNRFFVDWIGDQYYSALLGAVQRVFGERISGVVLQVGSGDQGELFGPGQAPERGSGPLEEPVTANAPGGTRKASLGYLLPKYTFENFVVGASNKFAHAGAEAVANHPGDHYNPLFIYGGVGLGKSHLISAIGHRVLERLPTSRVGYISAEAFMNELISAIKRRRADDFKGRFRRLDVLIIDDVQFLAGREGTQEEFFHTFNALHGSHRQIVLSSDRFPKDIPHLEDRLRNRFEWGLITDIQPPDIETRVAILLRKAEAGGLQVPHNVALFLAARFENNIRELEGSLTRLGAWASLSGKPITLDFAREALKSLVRDRTSRVTIEVIQRVTADRYGIRVSDLKSKLRTQNLALSRQVAMYMSRKLTVASFPKIGEKFGGRDHSTVVHAVQVIQKRRNADSAFGEQMEILERLIETRAEA